MSVGTEIKSEKILIKDVFKNWFNVPGYQRPYVWGNEQIHDLLDDISFAAVNKPDSEYFLGSFVYQIKPADEKNGRQYEENDLLDGQQRLTTIVLLLSVLRDLSDNSKLQKSCQKFIYQEADEFEEIPERVRLHFDVRNDAKQFLENYVIQEGGTLKTESLERISENGNCGDLSVRNMAHAILIIRKFFKFEDSPVDIEIFYSFLLNKVLLIYVATEDLDDAFRLFTILNDRGIPLRNSDILKSLNLGALDTDTDKEKYARLWEEAEGELGWDFERFLGHIRTILVKDKARGNLLQEFEDKIYEPKEKDKSTGKLKPVLLSKGKATFTLIERYLEYYRQLFSGANYDVSNSWEFDNLIQVMLIGLPATDWVPPLLRFYDRFSNEGLMEFLKALSCKFSADWIVGKTPTDRIASMNELIKLIESAADANVVLSAKEFDFEEADFLRVINGPVYGRRFTKYINLFLDFCYTNHAQRMNFGTISVEHILPQNPADNSQWVRDFTHENREKWTHRLGNLIIITRRKNSSLSRLDYSQKKIRYFQKNIDTCPNSLRVLQANTQWTPTELRQNHNAVIDKVKDFYGIA